MKLNRKRFLSICSVVMPTLVSLIFCVAPSNALAQTPLAGVVKISAGSSHTCALTSNGGVKCWGSNQFGQMGVSLSLFSSSTPVDVPGLSSGVAAIAAGELHTCALTTLGGVKCWGLNSNGQLGDNGPLAVRFTPADVSGLTSGIGAIAAGRRTTCAVTTGGAAKCWGANGVGQLGDGTTTQALIPVDVFGLASGVSAIATHNGHSCALTTVGGIKCWGQNNLGQLGIGFPPNSSLVPVDVISAQSMPALTGANAIAVNFASSCAVKGGGVLCWGDNSVGQLGNDSALFIFGSNVPVPVLSGASLPALTGVSVIASGSSHTCVVTNVGGVKCWGFNTSGQLGEGDNAQRSRATPVDVLTAPGMPPLAGVSAITAGDQHTCALMISGGVKCWGANFAGQVGDNSSNNYRFSPVDVLVLPPLSLNAVQSRKTHGQAGDFDLLLDTAPIISGPVTVEPRTSGGAHLIVFQFNGLISATGSVSVVGSSGMPIGTSSVTSSGNDVLVTLTGVADNSRATVSLANVNGTLNPSASIGFLIGDVNNSRSVNSSDISSVKARSGQTTDATNFKFDINASGAINSSDISAVKARSGLVLPP